LWQAFQSLPFLSELSVSAKEKKKMFGNTGTWKDTHTLKACAPTTMTRPDQTRPDQQATKMMYGWWWWWWWWWWVRCDDIIGFGCSKA